MRIHMHRATLYTHRLCAVCTLFAVFAATTVQLLQHSFCLKLTVSVCTLCMCLLQQRPQRVYRMFLYRNISVAVFAATTVQKHFLYAQLLQQRQQQYRNICFCTETFLLSLLQQLYRNISVSVQKHFCCCLCCNNCAYRNICTYTHPARSSTHAPSVALRVHSLLSLPQQVSLPQQQLPSKQDAHQAWRQSKELSS